MKALILIIKKYFQKEDTSIEYESQEIKNLLKTYGIFTSDVIIIKLDKITPAFYIGSGKVKEINEIIKKEKYELIIFNENLSYSQTRNLENNWDVKVIDKTFLIIEIFKQRAKTQEGKLQVELANLKYNLSRIKGSEYYLDQQYGMIGTRGSGERKIEYEKRIIREKISKISKQIKNIKKHRQIQRTQRMQLPVPIISIVGYTNAGKSTLLNTLSKSNDVYSDNLLFATLDPTARRIKIKGGFYAIFVDTVGFINKLPHLLVAAFSATLEEILYSDLIIHLHDITADIKKQNEVVKKTLNEIGASQIPLINVFNKIDLVKGIEKYRIEFENLNPIFISALNKEGIDNLIETVYIKISQKWKDFKVELSITENSLINKIKSEFFILDEYYNEKNVTLLLKLTEENKKRLEKILQNSFL
ncbi:MAG: GTPase HflX [Elusimicrobiales bacterium]|nr:GTPase HflX [Elusimicrobiales bacterium]